MALNGWLKNKKMKNFFTVLGIIFAVILAVFLIAAVIFIPRALKLNHEAAAYIQTEVPKIVANWSPQELTNQATAGFLAAAKSPDEVDRLFKMFSQLGTLKHLDTPNGTVFSGAYTGTGAVTIGNYAVRAEFEKGPANIKIQLLRVGDAWKINGFWINSEVFLPPKT